MTWFLVPGGPAAASSRHCVGLGDLTAGGNCNIRQQADRAGKTEKINTWIKQVQSRLSCTFSSQVHISTVPSSFSSVLFVLFCLWLTAGAQSREDNRSKSTDSNLHAKLGFLWTGHIIWGKFITPVYQFTMNSTKLHKRREFKMKIHLHYNN